MSVSIQDLTNMQSQVDVPTVAGSKSSERELSDHVRVRRLLDHFRTESETRSFIPHSVFKRGDAQTIAAYLWPQRFRLRDENADEDRLFDVDTDSSVLARCRWQPNRTEHPTLVLWHGMEGSVASAYMLTTTDKAFRAGFNVVRVNIRNFGSTEHLTPTLYRGGMSRSVRDVIDELIKREGLSRLFIAGFSL